MMRRLTSGPKPLPRDFMKHIDHALFASRSPKNAHRH
jgi:hypothetical protein